MEKKLLIGLLAVIWAGACTPSPLEISDDTHSLRITFDASGTDLAAGASFRVAVGKADGDREFLGSVEATLDDDKTADVIAAFLVPEEVVVLVEVESGDTTKGYLQITNLNKGRLIIDPDSLQAMTNQDIPVSGISPDPAYFTCWMGPAGFYPDNPVQARAAADNAPWVESGTIEGHAGALSVNMYPGVYDVYCAAYTEEYRLGGFPEVYHENLRASWLIDGSSAISVIFPE